MLNAKQIIAVQDLKTKAIQIQEWPDDKGDCTYYIKMMNGVARSKVEAEWSKPRPHKGKALLACLTLCDAEGVMLFNETDVDDLNEKAYTALDTIAEQALAFNEMTESAIELLKKTLAQVASTNSPSDSQPT
jgi:hypothetical protein